MEHQTNVLHDFNEPTYELASIGQRLINVLIDVISFYVLMAIFGVIGGLAAVTFQSDSGSGMPPGSVQLFFLLAYVVVILLYYTLLEGAKGKSLGKLITKTKAVQIDGSPLGYKKAFLRSIYRFVPLEFISIFFSRMMWHDQWTYTMVIKEK
jgi:uncharacterized RDD family membrane protein YckC